MSSLYVIEDKDERVRVLEEHGEHDDPMDGFTLSVKGSGIVSMPRRDMPEQYCFDLCRRLSLIATAGQMIISCLQGTYICDYRVSTQKVEKRSYQLIANSFEVVKSNEERMAAWKSEAAVYPSR